MASLLCFTPSSGDQFIMSIVGTPDGCNVGYLASHYSDYFTLSSLSSLFQLYFQFDASVFELVLGANLLAFVIGHGLGRMMMAWRKSF
jgi:hypothetical protein